MSVISELVRIGTQIIPYILLTKTKPNTLLYADKVLFLCSYTKYLLQHLKHDFPQTRQE